MEIMLQNIERIAIICFYHGFELNCILQELQKVKIWNIIALSSINAFE